jgi:hypothetical protein
MVVFELFSWLEKLTLEVTCNWSKARVTSNRAMRFEGSENDTSTFKVIDDQMLAIISIFRDATLDPLTLPHTVRHRPFPFN